MVRFHKWDVKLTGKQPHRVYTEPHHLGIEDKLETVHTVTA